MPLFRFPPVALGALLALHVHSRGAAAPAWVERSNAQAAVLLRAIGTFAPEQVSGYGLTAYDDGALDLTQGFAGRSRMALLQAESTLEGTLAHETDPQVREDLEIMIHACQIRIEGSELAERTELTYLDVGQLIFSGEFGLLQDQVAAARRPAALARLKKYVGLGTGNPPLTELAKARFAESLREPGRLGPYRPKVEQDLANAARYVDGIRQLYGKFAIPGGEAALGALAVQLQDYGNWVRQTVLPHARDDFRLPPDVYAHELKQVGLAIAPADLIRKAQLEFTETQNELETLAPLVARAHGFAATDYRSVVRLLKKEQLSATEIEPYYHEVIGQIEAIIRRERIVTLPDRAMVMRLASEAETAAQPAPHMQPPALINNTGQRGQFILPLGNPAAGSAASDAYDDFTFKAAAWTLTAHEGRPGHELQFSAMVERGVSQARSIFAFNSVNVEGWALYAEAEFKPYEPLDGQLIALQLRLLRAARAILDPMLNLGLISKERAHDVLTEDVVLSEAFTREEVDRFTFRTPGQATAYFYGYSRLMELRGAAEIALGRRFDRLAFNNFIMGQGLLPPDLLAAAVTAEFFPAAK